MFVAKTPSLTSKQNCAQFGKCIAAIKNNDCMHNNTNNVVCKLFCMLFIDNFSKWRKRKKERIDKLREKTFFFFAKLFLSFSDVSE